MPIWMMLSLVVIFVLYVWGYSGQRQWVRFRYPLMLLVGAGLDWYASLKMAPALDTRLNLHALLGLAGLFGMSAFAVSALIEYRLLKFGPHSAAPGWTRFNQTFGTVALLVWLGSLVTGLLIALRILPRI